MGLYKQPNHWTCGPYALKHALVTLGRMVDAREIARLAGTHWWSGTDETRLARAAREYDCNLPAVRRTDPLAARRALVGYLDRHIPVLLCVDDWSHWICAVHHQRGRFVVLDSRRDPVMLVHDWGKLRSRWMYVDKDEPGATLLLYDLHPCLPRFKVRAQARFSVPRARVLRHPAHLDLAHSWDEYVEDLLDICRPRTKGSDPGGLSMAEFLRKNREVLLDRVAHWHGDVTPAALARVTRNLRFVAETYGMIIPKSRERRALIDLAALLAMWAAATEGVRPIYTAAPQKRRRR